MPAIPINAASGGNVIIQPGTAGTTKKPLPSPKEIPTKICLSESWVTVGVKIGMGLTLWGAILSFLGLIGWVFLMLLMGGVNGA